MPTSARSLIQIVAVAAATILGAARPTTAAPITWEFNGPVNFTYGQWVNILPLGTPAQLTISWEPSTPSVPGCPAGSGLYPAIKGATLSFLTYSVPYGGGAIEVAAPGGNCGYPDLFDGVEFHMFVQPYAGTPPFPGAFEEILALVYPADRFGADLSSILAPVENGFMFVQTPHLGNNGFRFGAPLQVVAPVPEPTTVVLLGSGLAFAIRAARRRSVSPRTSKDR